MEVTEGPGSEIKRFYLEEGSRVLVVEEAEGWLKIRDDQGRDGWARAEEVGEI
jgi:SH3-like domain-containing protein